MDIIYSGQYPERITKFPIIFLAGCSPRGDQSLPWRSEAIQYFKEDGFDGTLIIPEPENGKWEDYDDVVDWEVHFMNHATGIMFWVPRSISDGILGLTTNFEFGEYLASGKIIYGRPEGSDKNRYLDMRYHRYNNALPLTDLKTLVKQTIKRKWNTTHTRNP